MLHIDLPSRSEVETLAAHRGAPAVSLYLRTTPLSEAAAADRIALKNLLKEAVRQLEEAGTEKRQIWPIEEAVTALVEDDEFWAFQANSLAILATPERVQTYRLPNRLASMVEVSDRFHLNPLLRCMTFPHHAYVLAIGMGAVRLVEVTPDLPPREVKIPGLPRDAAASLGRRSHVERAGQMRSGEATSENAILARYARAVDQALRPVLKGESVPLIVAAAEPMASVFRGVSRYGHVARQAIVGSADDVADHVLATEARRILDALYAEELADLARRFADRAAHGRGTTDVAQAARAATFGAVETLLVDMDSDISGSVDDADGTVVFAARPDAVNYGVVDEIARRVLRAGGRVVAARRADIPGQGELAAILRFPV